MLFRFIFQEIHYPVPGCTPDEDHKDIPNVMQMIADHKFDLIVNIPKNHTKRELRESNVTERSLVTVCRLVNATRSDDNPNGFTIEGFTIVS